MIAGRLDRKNLMAASTVMPYSTIRYAMMMVAERDTPAKLTSCSVNEIKSQTQQEQR